MSVQIQKLQRGLRQPILIRDPLHLFYLTGHYLIDGGFLLITKKEVVLFGGYLEKISGIKTDMLKNLPLYLKDHKSVAIEDSVSVKQFEFLKALLKRTRLQSVVSPVRAMRLTKTSDELAKMKKAYSITAKVFAEVKKAFKKKQWREKDLADFIKLTGHNLGADDISFPTIVASGANAAVPHHMPTEKIIKPGESVILDFGFKVNGYCSDFSRTVFLKKIDPQMKGIYQAVEKAYQQGIKAVHASVHAKKVDAAARDYLDEQGFGEFFIHSLGHGTGLEVHEAPNLYPNSIDTLKSNMVFSIEPGVYLPGVGGVRIEDLVYLKGNKANYFQKVSTKLSDMIV